MQRLKLTSLVDLKTHLETIPRLEGNWVSKTNGYERDFAEIINAELNREQDWDCIWNDLHIELKKGKHHAWLDLVRYSEYLEEPSNEPIVTLFLFYDGTRITSVHAVTIDDLIQVLRLDEVKANTILELNNSSLHPLNVQSRLTKSDIRKVARFSVNY